MHYTVFTVQYSFDSSLYCRRL